MPVAIPTAAAPRGPTLLAGTVLVLAAAAAYANTIGVPFLFDDVDSLKRSEALAHFSLVGAMAGHSSLSGRPAAIATFLLDRAIGGDQVWSYHVVNILIHAGAALVLFGLVRRTLEQPLLPKRRAGAPLAIGFSVALLWSLHPLQTESVTYIVQRVQALMGLFYLLTLYAFVRSAAGGRKAWWQAVSIAACLLGMASKEDMASAPLIVLLYDRTFIAGTFRQAWARSRAYYCCLASTWLALGYLMTGTHSWNGTVGYGSGISAMTYLATQCHAVVHYLRLTVWPAPLVFDYGRWTVGGMSHVWPQALFLGALAAATLWGAWRRRPWSFLGVWFFATLAPTSSFVPLVSQTMAEHRVYLALAAPLAALVLGLEAALGRRMLAAAVLLAVTFGFLTFRRNGDYRSAVALWTDTASKFPTNPRAFQNLGASLVEEGRWSEAIAACGEALRIGPDLHGVTHANLGRALLETGQPAAALAEFKLAVNLDAGDVELNNDMGMALAALGRWGEAVSQYEITLGAKPDHAEAQNNLGNALAKIGRTDEALSHYEAAVRIRPGFAEAQSNWGRSLSEAGRAAEAVPHFAAALAMRPGPDPESDLARALIAAGRPEEAIPHLESAVKAAPDRAEFRIGLGDAYAVAGRRELARSEYESALQREPTSVVAHYNFANLLSREGEFGKAVEHYEAAIGLNPTLAQAHHNLAMCLMELGRPGEAVVHFEETVRLTPDSADAHHGLALALGEVRRWKEAETQEVIALQLQPDFREAQEHLDWLRRQ